MTISAGVFLFFSKCSFSVLFRRRGGRINDKKIVQNDKNVCLSRSLSQEPYVIWSSFMVHMCKMKIFRGKFFHFFKIFIFWVVERVKGQKKAQNGKKFCPSHSIYQELNIIWLWFLVNMCKLMISHFFKILIFRAFRGVKVQKMTHNYQFLSIALYIFGTVDHIIRVLVHKCEIIIFPVAFLCLFNKSQRFLLAHFNSFFNSCFLSSSIYPNKGILSCGPPSSHVCDFSL